MKSTPNSTSLCKRPRSSEFVSDPRTPKKNKTVTRSSFPVPSAPLKPKSVLTPLQRRIEHLTREFEEMTFSHSMDFEEMNLSLPGDLDELISEFEDFEI